MSQPTIEPECGDIRASAFRTVLKPLGRIFQNEVSFILVVILCVGGYLAYLGCVKFEEFVRTQIPRHIEAINSGNKEVADAFSVKLTERDAQFAAELKQQREHYSELRKIDQDNIDRIERLATGKKTAATAAATAPASN